MAAKIWNDDWFLPEPPQDDEGAWLIVFIVLILLVILANA